MRLVHELILQPEILCNCEPLCRRQLALSNITIDLKVCAALLTNRLCAEKSFSFFAEFEECVHRHAVRLCAEVV